MLSHKLRVNGKKYVFANDAELEAFWRRYEHVESI